MTISYLSIIASDYPGVYAFDNTYAGSVYETLEVTANSLPLPPKAELDALVLERTKQAKWREIQAERDRRQSGGVTVAGYWWHTDQASRIQYIGLLMYGAGMPPGIMWKTMGSNFVEMTPTLAQQIFGTVANSDKIIFATAETHRAQMNASSDPDNYNFLTGSPTWPAIFGE